ncbi:hypothetical protein AAHC03_05284 [Spirometra sp. Aus1]
MKVPPGYQWIRLKLLHNNKERHQAFILLITFVVYALFHASRKPLSVVKTVFHKPCIPKNPTKPNCYWFGKGRRGLVMGIWNANTNTGNVIGSLLAGLFVNWQWGASFIVPGVVLLLSSYFVLIFLVDQPYAHLQLSSYSSDTTPSASLLAKEKQTPSYYTDVRTLSEVHDVKERPISFTSALCLPNVLAYAFTLFFSKLVSYTFLYWLPNFLASISVEKVSAEQAAVLSTIFDIGGIVGGVLAGFLSDNVSSDLSMSAHDASSRTIFLRAVTCAGMLAFAAPVLFWYQAIAASGSFLTLCLLFLCGLLVTGPCALITTAVSADLGTQPSLQGNSKALATVTAIIDGTGSLGAALGPFLTGALVPYGWPTVFFMLIAADLLALVISAIIASRSYHGLGKVMRLGTLNL